MKLYCLFFVFMIALSFVAAKPKAKPKFLIDPSNDYTSYVRYPSYHKRDGNGGHGGYGKYVRQDGYTGYNKHKDYTYGGYNGYDKHKDYTGSYDIDPPNPNDFIKY